jgi:hypothetical protein
MKNITNEIRVILLDENYRAIDKETVTSVKKSDLLIPPSMKTKGWKFDREEANAR